MNTVNNQFPNFAAEAAAAETPLEAVLQATAPHQQQSAAADDQENLGANNVDGSHIAQFFYAEESSVHKGGVAGILSLFGSGCLDCKHLVEGGEMDYRVCHFNKGNKHCPASSIKIQFVGEKVKWESKVNKVKDLPEGSMERRVAMRNLYDKACEIADESLQSHVLSLLGF